MPLAAEGHNLRFSQVDFKADVTQALNQLLGKNGENVAVTGRNTVIQVEGEPV